MKLKNNVFPILVLILFVTILQTNISAQNFQSVHPTRSNYFQTNYINMGFYEEEIDRCDATACLLGIRVDSITMNEDTVYYFSDYARGEEDVLEGICPSPSWLGSKMIWSSTEEIFFNGNGDSIFLQRQSLINNSWIFQNEEDGFFEASVDSIFEMVVLEQMDSVKSIRLVRKNLLGEIIDHPMNGFQILIGKSAGFIQVCDLYHFPNDITPKTLVGKTNPDLGVSLLKYRDIYDFNIGDERHYVKECTISPLGFYNEKIRIIVLDKVITEDAVTYTFENLALWKGADFPVSPLDSGVNKVVYEQTIDLSLNTNFNTHPFEIFQDDYDINRGFNYQYKDQCDEWTKVIQDDFETSEICLQTSIDIDRLISYKACLGLVELDNFSFPTSCHEELVYYKKGDIEKGTPIDFETLTNTDDPNLESSSVRVFPNPFDQTIFVEMNNTGNKISSYKLFNVIGNVVLSSVNFSPQASIVIDVNHLPVGTYIIELTGIKGTLSKRIIKN